MKIALIEPIGGHGGMDFYDYGLSQGLGENNVEVHYFTSCQTTSREYKNVITHLCFDKVWDTSNKLLKLYFFLKGYFKALRAAKREGINVIHMQFFDLGWLNFLVMLQVSMFRFQKILTLHDVSSFKSKNSRFFEQFILKSFHRIIVHNQLSYRQLLNKIVSKEHIHIIPHGNYLPFVDELEYSPESRETLKLLFFGQIKKVKGLEVLLRALSTAIKEDPNIHLTIAGKVWHDDLDKYHNLIISLGLEDFVTTHFKYIPNDAVAAYFKAADIVVLPYKKIYQSGVLLLSMSYGRVALTSNLPAFKEIVEDGKTGYLFESENSEDLSKVLLQIAANREKLKEVNKRASELLKSDFDWSIIGKKTKQLYTSL